MSITQGRHLIHFLTSMISNYLETGGQILLPQKHHMVISISNLLCCIDPLNSVILIARKVVLECVDNVG